MFLRSRGAWVSLRSHLLAEPIFLGQGRSGVATLLIALPVFVAILVARRPDLIVFPQFVPEDGQVLYLGTYFGSPVDQLLRPYNGYLHLLLRVAAWAERLVPVVDAPAVSALASVAITVGSALYAGVRATFLDLRARWLLALFVLVAPPAAESLGVLINAPWYLAVVLAVALLSEPLSSKPLRLIEAAATFAIGLTGAVSILLIPLTLRRLREPRAVAVLAAGIAQGVLVLTLGRIPIGTDMTIMDRVSFLVSHGLAEPVLGVRLTAAALAAGWVLPILGGLVLVLVLMTTRRASMPFLYLWVAAIAAATLYPQGSRLEYLEAGYGVRYVLLPAVCAAAIVLMSRPRPARLALASALIVGIALDFSISEPRDYAWINDSRCIPGPSACRVSVGGSGGDAGVWWPGASVYEQYPYGNRFP